MSREERLYKLREWLRDARGVTSEAAQRALEVSASTLKRDITYLRDRMGMPLKWAPARRAWELDEDAAPVGQQFELPGLWFSAQEVHALLTMQHLLSHLDAGGLLAPHVDPLMRRLSKILGLSLIHI